MLIEIGFTATENSGEGGRWAPMDRSGNKENYVLQTPPRSATIMGNPSAIIQSDYDWINQVDWFNFKRRTLMQRTVPILRNSIPEKVKYDLPNS